jgi:hypothetical protein
MSGDSRTVRFSAIESELFRFCSNVHQQIEVISLVTGPSLRVLAAKQCQLLPQKRSCTLPGVLRGLSKLVRHPLAKIAMLQLGLAFLHKRDAGPAVRHAVAIENGQVHQRVIENVSDDRGERLSTVDMSKATVTAKTGRREQDDATDSRNDFGHRLLVVMFRDAEQTPAEEMISLRSAL